MAIQDHPNYAGLTTFVEALLTKIKNKQAEYFTEKKKYFQGIKTPATGKADGHTLMDIAYGLHPSDQDDSWYTFDSSNFKATTKLPAHICIDVYQSKRGWGWILTMDFYFPGIGPDAYGTDGDHWFYKHNAGPELREGVWDEWHIKQDIVL